MLSETILCAANSYERKYYLNPEFGKLPDQVKDELKAMSVLFAEEIGGVFEMHFNEEGELMISTSAEEGDLSYDEIGAGLLIRKIKDTKQELLQSLELYYRVTVLHETVDLDEEQ